MKLIIKKDKNNNQINLSHHLNLLIPRNLMNIIISFNTVILFIFLKIKNLFLIVPAYADPKEFEPDP